MLPTSGDTPGRAGALTDTALTASQLTSSAMVTGRNGAERFSSASARGHLLRRELNERREPGDHHLHVARILAHHHDAVAGHVLRKLDAVAIEDLAAFRRDQADVDAVFLGQQAELVGLIDLQVSHPRSQRAHEDKLRAAQQHRTAAQPAVVGIGLGSAASHAVCLMVVCMSLSTPAQRVQLTRRGTADPHHGAGDEHCGGVDQNRHTEFQ